MTKKSDLEKTIAKHAQRSISNQGMPKISEYLEVGIRLLDPQKEDSAKAYLDFKALKEREIKIFKKQYDLFSKFIKENNAEKWEESKKFMKLISQRIMYDEIFLKSLPEHYTNEEFGKCMREYALNLKLSNLEYPNHEN